MEVRISFTHLHLHPVPTAQGTGWVPDLGWILHRREKLSPLSGFSPVQPSHYAYWAIPILSHGLIILLSATLSPWANAKQILQNSRFLGLNRNFHYGTVTSALVLRTDVYCIRFEVIPISTHMPLKWSLCVNFATHFISVRLHGVTFWRVPSCITPGITGSFGFCLPSGILKGSFMYNTRDYWVFWVLSIVRYSKGFLHV
jgi:hypothetical protein